MVCAKIKTFSLLTGLFDDGADTPAPPALSIALLRGYLRAKKDIVELSLILLRKENRYLVFRLLW